MYVKIKQEGANLEEIVFALTFKLESVMSFGNHGIFHLLKYCFYLEKNVNYRTPLKMSLRRAILGFTLGIVWKIEAPLTKNNS